MTYAEITPERIALISLQDCLQQLEMAQRDVDRLVFAAKAAHLTLQAALTAALAGPANVGAHEPKLRKKHLEFFDAERAGQVTTPPPDRVMSFDHLLSEARSNPLPWASQLLVIGQDDADLLERLTRIRHAVEHPKQGYRGMEAAWIVAAITVAVPISLRLLDGVRHHFEPAELDLARVTAQQIEAYCALYD